MKMIQILINDGQLYGLDAEGIVYWYRRATDPYVTSAPIPIPIPEPYDAMSLQRILGDAREDINRISGIEPEWKHIQEKQIAAERQAMFEHQQRMMQQRKELQQCQRYYESVTSYVDGYTEGWVPLLMGLSKTVPHSNDPTRNERC